MKAKWTRRALRQLVEAQDYLAADNPQAARQMGERVAEAVRLISGQSQIGRPGRVIGTREWPVGRAPYLLVYKLDDAAGVARALGDIARAKGMSQVARKTGLSRESLYKALSAGGNPTLATVLKVTHALGLRLHVKAV